eukprot:1153297-Pelagomonas_calceolata.AAC.2
MALRFPQRPVLLATAQCLILCLFKPYPSVADHVLYMGLLPLLQVCGVACVIGVGLCYCEETWHITRAAKQLQHFFCYRGTDAKVKFTHSSHLKRINLSCNPAGGCHPAVNVYARSSLICWGEQLLLCPQTSTYALRPQATLVLAWE